MCAKCLEIAAQIDPEFLNLMNDLEPEYRALTPKPKSHVLSSALLLRQMMVELR